MSQKFRFVHRSTPTCVGKALLQGLRALLRRNHPHIRGESSNQTPLPTFAVESPPHTWGKLEDKVSLILPAGITPTYVGKAFSHTEYQRDPWNYPHIRGENDPLLRSIALTRGSPPHTWGKLGRERAACNGTRITPTYVGNAAYRP